MSSEKKLMTDDGVPIEQDLQDPTTAEDTRRKFIIEISRLNETDNNAQGRVLH